MSQLSWVKPHFLRYAVFCLFFYLILVQCPLGLFLLGAVKVSHSHFYSFSLFGQFKDQICETVMSLLVPLGNK